MVFRSGGGERASYGWIRADRTTQPEWALPAEAIISVLPPLLLAVNFLGGTIGPTVSGYVVLAVIVAVLMALPVFAILRQSVVGLALMFAPVAAGWMLPGEMGHAAGTYIGLPWAAIAAVNLAYLRR
ncbi:hypothetical protein ACFWGD_01785 [Corynebacterium sp. NPDC060344]|uniref:hypothetical protein n=1 Tax=Corynebacterium sp. NPDC060344 TaxID=3347101 RepID=UPI0036690506